MLQQFSHCFKAMGSPCEIRLLLNSRHQAKKIIAHAVKEAHRLEQKYSRYLSDSVISTINRSAGDVKGLMLDKETCGLIDYAQVCFEQSEGLFDISSGILRRAWDFNSGKLPSPASIEQLLAKVGWHKISWQNPRLILPLAGMELDFGGLVKEYAVDVLATQCYQLGVRHGLVDLGGDIYIIGPQADNQAWRIGVRHPDDPGMALAYIELSQGGLASSGDYERSMWVEGVRYSHLLDPCTGWPVAGLRAVSVAADKCLTAGSAATIAMLKPQQQGKNWLDDLGLPNLRFDSAGKISGSLETCT